MISESLSYILANYSILFCYRGSEETVFGEFQQHLLSRLAELLYELEHAQTMHKVYGYISMFFFLTCSTKGNYFMTSRPLPGKRNPFKMGSTLKGKNLLSEEQIFPLKVDLH